MTAALNYNVALAYEECCRCGIVFAMPETLQRRALENRSIQFYCPRGHPQHYIGKTEAQKLREELDAERRRKEDALSRANYNARRAAAMERSRAAVKGHHTRLKKRIAGGVCPCCRRTFKQLARHMKSQHPNFDPEALVPGERDDG